MGKLEYHEAANIFPMLDIDAFREFKADIKKNGLREPIEMFDGKIIDGRNRYQACLELDYTCPQLTKHIDDPVAYVLSKNLHRRQLTASQRSMVAAKAKELYEKEAKERMSAGGGDKKSKSAKSGPVIVPDPIKGDSRDKAGKAVGVSGSLVDRASKVLAEATPELIADVEEGRVSVSAAARKVKESKEEKATKQDAKAIDAKKRPVPKDLIPVFDTVAEFKSLSRELTGILKRAEVLANGKAGAWLEYGSLRTDIENAKSSIKFGTPYIVCTYCNGRGDGCKACRGSGYLNQTPTSRNSEEV